ncbi:hypothetical protein EDB84DRAFT_1512251 [Lactarius hengduanensis]|nr:hypothetical protein EDB84DRAFT_1512251 [Lactarius hengduanensis]
MKGPGTSSFVKHLATGDSGASVTSFTIFKTYDLCGIRYPASPPLFDFKVSQAQITYIASMSTTKYSPHISNGVSGVTSHRVGMSLIDVIRIIVAGVALRYYFTSRSRGLLQQSYAPLPQEEYKCASKDVLKIAKLASRRAVDDNLIAQALGGGAGAASTLRNPFSDPHAASALTDVNNPNLVEMPSIRSEPTGELHGRDAFTQQVIATFPPEVDVGDGERGLVPIRSSHELFGSRSDIDDGTMDNGCRFCTAT